MKNPSRAGVKRVVCLGHSLGGALATMMAAWIRSPVSPYGTAGVQECWSITFGSPRVRCWPGVGFRVQGLAGGLAQLCHLVWRV